MYYGDEYEEFGPYADQAEMMNDFDDMDEFIDDDDAFIDEYLSAYGGSSIHEFGEDDLDDLDDDDFGLDDDDDDDDDDEFGAIGLATIALIAAGSAAGAGGTVAAIQIARRNKRYSNNVGKYIKNRQKFASTGKKKYERRARRQFARLIKLWPKIKNKQGLSSPINVRKSTTDLIEGRPLPGQQGQGLSQIQQQQVQQAAATSNYARRQAEQQPDWMAQTQPVPFRRRRMGPPPGRRGFPPGRRGFPPGRGMGPRRGLVPQSQVPQIAMGGTYGAEMTNTGKAAVLLGVFAAGVLASGPIMDVIDDFRR
jgi:hypothetical protein